MSYLFKQKLILAIILNFIIFILEIIGAVLSIQRHGILAFTFYTENSNYYALFVSLIFCIGGIVAVIRQDYLYHWIHTLRFISTVCLTITFIIAVFVLMPFRPNMVPFMLFEGSSLYQHLLCPLLSLFSFLVLENQKPFSRNVIIYAIIPTIVYGVTCIILNILKVITGPYPFFYVYQIPWYVCVVSILGIMTISFFTTFGIYYLHNKKTYSLLSQPPTEPRKHKT